MHIGYIRKKRLMANILSPSSIDSPDNATGNIVVTCVHTSARNMVFASAIFLSQNKAGWGTLGAEYKKVIKAVPNNHSHCLIKINP